MLAKKDAKLPPVILAMKLIDSSNLTKIEKKLVLSGMDYSQKEHLFTQSKSSLRKFIGEQASVNESGLSSAIKLETFVADHEEALIAAGWQRKRLSGYRKNNFQSKSNVGAKCPTQNTANPTTTSCRTNPLGPDGEPLTCYHCKSIMHFKPYCPHLQGKIDDSKRSSKEDVILFTGNMQEDLMMLTRESWNSAVLDSACSSTVCGEKWISEFISKLDVSSRNLVKKEPSSKVFHFGGGEKLKSKGAVTFPCMLAGKAIRIHTDIVESNIPLLLSLTSMKKAKMVWDFAEGVATIFGNTVALDVTSCGHHSIPVAPALVEIEECLSAIESNTVGESKRKLLKLHLQFAHPTQDKFVCLLKDAKSWKEEFNVIVDEIYSNCTTCEVFKKTPDRPVVAMPEANEFGELLVMDLKSWKKVYILHMIDAFSRFSVSVVIREKTPQMVAHHFLTKWVGAGYGLCKKMKFDNGGEFSNAEIRELSDCLGIEIKTTAAGSPWQNGLCERNHTVTDRCLEKILDENPTLPLDVALAYANNAKNCLQMWNGFSSYQMVFGKNPKLPDIFHATLPQLEGKTHSELLAMHLNALQSARRAFIESQADEKIRRALRHRVRANLEHYMTGDKVYFKREDSNRWHGPGIVIGQERQVVFVRHGGVYVRVPTCRLKKTKSVVISPNDTEEQTEEESDNLEETEVPYSDTSEVNNEMQLNTEAEELPTIITAANEKEKSQEGPEPQEDEQGQEEPRNKFNANVKKGDNIKFRIEDGQDWHIVEITGQAGKKSGKNKFWYNVKEGTKEYSVDISRVKDLQIEEEIDETVNVVMVPRIDHGMPEIVAAKQKELDTWKEMEVYEEVPDVGQSCIQTNWIVTEKENGFKARLVVRGDQEDSYLQSDSPTCSKLAIRIFLAIAASKGYTVCTKDVKSAFLQGKDINRTIYLEPPKEEKKPFVIWKLKKVAYGLVDAARNWYESILEEMIAIGCRKSIYENALFYYQDNDGCLQGMMTSHVDDFLQAGNSNFEEKVISNVKTKFAFGKEAEIDFRYVGINIKQESEYISIDQEHYIKAIQEVPMPCTKTADHELPLTGKDIKAFRRLVGSLNWASIISRPDVSFEVVDLCTKFQAPTVGDLIKANKAVQRIKVSTVVIKYPRLILDENIKIVTFGDGSFRNLCKGVSSGSGWIIFLVDSNNRCCPISWTSRKLQRVVDSTLAAESLSLSNTIKDAIYIKEIMKELIGDRAKLPIYCVVDSKGTRDAVYSTKLVADKLTRLYIAAIKEHLENNTIAKIIHAPGKQMLADCLTKRGASSKLLLEVLQTGKLPNIVL